MKSFELKNTKNWDKYKHRLGTILKESAPKSSLKRKYHLSERHVCEWKKLTRRAIISLIDKASQSLVKVWPRGLVGAEGVSSKRRDEST